MKYFMLSDGTEVKIENSSGIIESMLDNKRIKVVLNNKYGDIDLMLYNNDIEKLFKAFKEV